MDPLIDRLERLLAAALPPTDRLAELEGEVAEALRLLREARETTLCVEAWLPSAEERMRELRAESLSDRLARPRPRLGFTSP